MATKKDTEYITREEFKLVLDKLESFDKLSEKVNRLENDLVDLQNAYIDIESNIPKKKGGIV